MTVALQGVGDQRERTSQHGGPGTADEQEGEDLQVLAGAERDEGEAQSTQHETHGVSYLHGLETGDDGGPHHRAHGLDGIEHTRPVASHLISLVGRVGSVPDGQRHGINHVGPHVEERGPAEELHQTYTPESRRGRLEQNEPVAAFVALVRRLRGNTVVLVIFLRVPLLHLHRGVDDAEDKYGGSHIERPDDGVGHDALGRHVAQAHPGEEEGEHEAHH